MQTETTTNEVSTDESCDAASVQEVITADQKAEFAGISKSAEDKLARPREILLSIKSIRTNNGWSALLRNLARLTALCATAGLAFLIATPAMAATIAALKSDFSNAADTMAAYVNTYLFDGWSYLATIDQPGFDAVVSASLGLTAIALAVLTIVLICQWRHITKLTMFNQPCPADKKPKPLVETNHVVLDSITRTWDPREPIEHGGLVLGYSTLLHKMYLSGEKAHCLIQAPPGVGKTIRMIMATLHCIFESEDSCIVVDPKGELYDNTYEAAVEACGADHVFVIDFFRWRRSDLYNIMSDVTHVFFKHMSDYEESLKRAAIAKMKGKFAEGNSLLLAARNSRIEAYAKAEERARDLVTALIPDLANSSDNFWRPSARTLLSALVLLVATYREEDWVNPVVVDNRPMPVPSTPEPEQRCMKTVRAILNAKGKAYTSNANGRHEERLPLEDLFAGLDQEHPAARAFTQAKNSKGQTLAGICSTLLNVLDSIITEESNMMSYATDFDLDKIGDEKTVIYFIVPEAQPAKYAYLPVFITQVYQACARSAARNGGEMKRYVHFVLEEFGNSPQIPRFANMINAGRGYGCRFYPVMQNAAQWSVVYGRETGSSIVDSLTCKCYLKVESEAEAKSLSESIGTCMVKTYGTSATYEASNAIGSRVSESESLISEPYVPIETLISWNPLWGTFTKRSELDENKLLNRLIFHRKRAVMAVYPTAEPQHIPTLKKFGLVRRDEAARRARYLQAKDKTAKRAVILPWLGEKTGQDTLEQIADYFKPGSIDPATSIAFKTTLNELIRNAIHRRAIRDAKDFCTPKRISEALSSASQDQAAIALYRQCKKLTDHRLTHIREITKEFERTVWSKDEKRYGDRFANAPWQKDVGTHTFDLPEYKAQQIAWKEAYLEELKEEIKNLVQHYQQAA